MTTMSRQPTRRGPDGQGPLGRGAAQTAWCARIDAIRIIRSFDFLVLAVAVPAAVYVALMAIPDVDGAATHGGAPFASVGGFIVAATLGSLGAGLATGGRSLAADRTSGWLRNLSLVPVPRSHMLVGRALAGIMLAVPPVLMLSAIAALLDRADLAPGGMATVVACAWLGAVPFTLLGMLVGLAAPGPRSASAATAAIYAIFGALVLPAVLPGTPLSAVATIGFMAPTFDVGDLAWSAIRGLAIRPVDLAFLVGQAAALAAAIAYLGARSLGPRWSPGPPVT